MARPMWLQQTNDLNAEPFPIRSLRFLALDSSYCNQLYSHISIYVFTTSYPPRSIHTNVWTQYINCPKIIATYPPDNAVSVQRPQSQKLNWDAQASIWQPCKVIHNLLMNRIIRKIFGYLKHHKTWELKWSKQMNKQKDEEYNILVSLHENTTPWEWSIDIIEM